MQPISTHTKVINVQTRMEAEILEINDTSVTFRSLPVGRPATTSREKFDMVFKVIATGESPPEIPAAPRALAQSDAPIPQTEKPNKTQKRPKKTKSKLTRKGKKRGRPPKPKPTFTPEELRTLRNISRRQRYQQKDNAAIKASSLAYYHRRQAEIKAGIRPPKALSEEEKEIRRAKAREYARANKDKIAAWRKKARRAKSLRDQAVKKRRSKSPINIIEPLTPVNDLIDVQSKGENVELPENTGISTE